MEEKNVPHPLFP